MTVRYLLVHHPMAVCVVSFIAVMAVIKYVVAPGIVGNFGIAGVVAFIGAMVGLGYLIDRH